MSYDAKEIAAPEDIGEFFSFAYMEGMTDGLPVIPPTKERVQDMAAASGIDVQTVIAEIPPRGGVATIEKLAINAVMAGCLPEYFPVIVAAVEAMMQPQFNLIGIQTTTNPVSPVLLVNGPIRQAIDLNCGAGAFGPGRRANATIGRAIRLILLNIGGAIPGEVDKAILGMPGKYGFCFGELEEQSPWLPFHVEQGFQASESTVTVISGQGTQSLAASYLQPISTLMMLANAMTAYGANSYTKGNGNPLVIFPPAHAKIFADGGWDKPKIRAWLFEHTAFPLSEMPAEPRLLDTTSRQQIRDGKVYICEKAENIAIVVAGGPELNHVGFVANFGSDLGIAKIRSMPAILETSS
jgi:hypothetical protein